MTRVQSPYLQSLANAKLLKTTVPPVQQAAIPPTTEHSVPVVDATLAAAEVMTDAEYSELAGNELSVSDDDVSKSFGQFKKLLTVPAPGSFLAYLQNHKVGKVEIEKYFVDKYWKQLATCFFDDTVSLPTYALWSLVLPHRRAVELSENVMEIVKDKKLDEFVVLSKVTGLKIENRGDLSNVLRMALRRYPKVLDLVMGMMK